MITLPFPPSALSPQPEQGQALAVRSKAFKNYKFQCFALLSQFRTQLIGQSRFIVTFHPPSARRFDRDNLIARFKAGQDALAEVSRIDDFHFVMTYEFGAPVKGGSVVVSVDAAQARAA